MTADDGRGTKDQGPRANDTPARQRLAPWSIGLRVAVLLLVIIALVAPLIIWRGQIAALFAEREWLISAVRGAGAWGPLALIGLYIAQVLIAPIPGQFISFAAGYLYGFWPGLLYCWLAAVIGSAAAMGLARLAGRPLIVRFVSLELLDRLDRLAAGRGLGFFFLVFLIPGLPDDATCFLAGLTRLPLSALLVAAAIGRMPGIAAGVWAGASAERVGWQTWLALGGLAVVAVFVWWRYGAAIQAWWMSIVSRASDARKRP
jgi:uncharacterized membrane protein YdjX (TVP38/TMEM64 family)